MKTSKIGVTHGRPQFAVRSRPSLWVYVALILSLQLSEQSIAADPMDKQVSLNVAANSSLENALIEWGTAAGLTIMINTSTVNGRVTEGVQGTLSAREALKALLRHSGLGYAEEGGRVRIAPTESLLHPTLREQPHDLNGTALGSDSQEHPYLKKSVENDNDSRRASLEEVVVTAQKREERLQDVPVPVTALTADTLVESNQLRLQDYYQSVPGLSMTSQGNGDASLAIRGITTGYGTNPSVGITIDDVPYGSSSYLTNGDLYLPDLDPSDLARVEVLRGPQGTLYGASSIGGLLKFVTVAPSTDGMNAQVQGQVEGVHNGDEPGYGFRGSINVPLGDTLAVRGSAFTRRDAGYINNSTYGLEGVNQTDVSGGHFAALWKPYVDLSIKLSALVQNTDADGNSDVLASGSGPLMQATLPNSGRFGVRVRLYSANITAKVGDINITSVTGYGINKANISSDVSASYGGPGGYSELFGVTGALGATHTETKKFSQEIRLTSSWGRTFDWLLGGFYTHESSTTQQPIEAADGTSGAPVGLLANFNFPSVFEEAAAFADLTAHFTEQFDVQLGGRYSSNHQIYNETDTGPLTLDFFGIPSPLVYPTEHSSGHAVTYLFTPEFKLSPDLMAYARLASGYRPGGPNADAILFGFPAQYGSDKTYNYELGLKGEALNQMVSFDASVYYIDWKDIQIGLYSSTGFFFSENAASAKSEGVEVSGRAKPSGGLTLSGWISWNEANLTSSFPASGSAIGASGDRLPYSSRWSGNFSVDQEFALTAKMSGFVAGAVSYVGDRDGAFNSVFTPSQLRAVFPAYAKTDLRMGVRRDSWTVTAFLNNATDRRGVLSNLPSLPNYLNYIQPRTVGLSIAKSF